MAFQAAYIHQRRDFRINRCKYTGLVCLEQLNAVYGYWATVWTGVAQMRRQDISTIAAKASCSEEDVWTAIKRSQMDGYQPPELTLIERQAQG